MEQKEQNQADLELEGNGKHSEVVSKVIEERGVELEKNPPQQFDSNGKPNVDVFPNYKTERVEMDKVLPLSGQRSRADGGSRGINVHGGGGSIDVHGGSGGGTTGGGVVGGGAKTDGRVAGGMAETDEGVASGHVSPCPFLLRLVQRKRERESQRGELLGRAIHSPRRGSSDSGGLPSSGSGNGTLQSRRLHLRFPLCYSCSLGVSSYCNSRLLVLYVSKTTALPLSSFAPEKISSMMRQIAVTVAMLLLVALEIPTGLTLPSTVPAFLWSPLEDGNGIKEAVNYQTLSTKDLAKSVLSEGGWSNLLCSGKEAQQHSVDVALLFGGREVGIRKS
ncbi:uncharacterized protein LOC131313896 [Rhododendron vialii]|uniref:uncharacterized protein LOC131313896 n=1 Tax=Rhododendron vialii TaxID=182163 RepID=UPI00265DD156|nr:uncharacterized protein LOC131313896 [Rhododendron vialii]